MLGGCTHEPKRGTGMCLACSLHDIRLWQREREATKLAAMKAKQDAKA